MAGPKKHNHNDTHDDSAPFSKPTIYMIRHGEKPPKLNGQDQDGLSAQGISRAQGLRQVFGKDSSYNIAYILAQHPKKDGSRTRPYDTVAPLAADLGIKINSKIDRDDAQGAAAAATSFAGPGNVLLCWEHGQLAGIAAAMGVRGYAEASGWTGPVEYPGERFDLIWTVRAPYAVVETVTSEGVVGVDAGAPGAMVMQSAVAVAKDQDETEGQDVVPAA